ncbi:54S ribosomal protein L39, mitochondrial [Homalodisca vitripennis]|nr:54S ribosomal protein L39, mitochondrial [Homalodisca vitripennis]
MNRHISTPYHVAQHINEFVSQKAALALVDGNKLWDFHRPLEADCSLSFLHLTDSEPHLTNKAYWRACSFLLGALAETCFKDNVECHLHSFPSPNVKSGSFVYDVQLSLGDWVPTKNELLILSAEFVKICRQHLPFHRLDVDPELAEEIFSYNPFKSSQIPDIASNSPGNKITLYRVGDHLDISRGPMINNTKLLGRTSITASDPATINGVSVCGVVHQEITGTTRKTTSTVTAEGEERKSLQHRHYLGRRQKGTRSQESSTTAVEQRPQRREYSSEERRLK